MTFEEKDNTNSGVGPEVQSASNTEEAKELNIPWQKAFLWVALGSSFVGALVATKTLTQVEKAVAEAREAAKPASLKVVKITAPDCADCFDINGAVEALKKQNVEIAEERSVAFDSPEGQELIQNLNITRVPTYVLGGEVSKESLQGHLKANGEIRNDKFVFTKIIPIFVDPGTKQPVGRVAVTYLTDRSCPQCVNPKSTVDAYKEANVKIIEETELAWDGPAAKKLIAQYRITKLPTFLMSADIDVYESVKNSWSKIGTVESDGTYVAREPPVPYRNLELGKIVGIVNIVYLTDSSCTECYDPKTIHRDILTQGFGIALGAEQVVDAATPAGQAFIRKYKITQAPTVFLSPDADQYANLKSVWPQVGTVEIDGWYVFRQMQLLGGSTYKDLVRNEVIKPAAHVPDTSQ